LALVLLLFIVVGFVLAETGNTVAKLDFGTVAGSDVAPGYISIPGGAGEYPIKADDLLVSWSNPRVLIAVSRANEESKIWRDYNGSSKPVTLKIAGLDPAKNYRFVFCNGDSQGRIGTRLEVGGKVFNLETASGQFKKIETIISAPNGFVDIGLRPLGSNIWALNALEIYETAAKPALADFDFSIEPPKHILRGAGTAIYQLKINSSSGYASPIDFSIAGLTKGFVANFIPSSARQFPFRGQLKITANSSVSPLPYQFLVTAAGRGSRKLVHQQVIVLEIQAASIPSASQKVGKEASTVTLPPVQYRPPSKGDFQKSAELLAFVEEMQRKVVVDRREIKTLGKLRMDLSPFPINTQLPHSAPGMVGAALDNLTQGGIIGSVVDTAPPVRTGTTIRRRTLMEAFLGIFIPGVAK